MHAGNLSLRAVLGLAALLVTLLPCVPGRSQQAHNPDGSVVKVRVHGKAEDTDGAPVAGVKFEFQLRGDPKREPMVTGADGKYEVNILGGMYDILVQVPDPNIPPYSGSAWLAGRPDITVNARVSKQKFEGTFEYDFLGEWQVVDERGKGIGPARMMFEAEDRVGRRSRFPVYVATSDEEKETDGATQTDPAGRLSFRIREASVVPDKIASVVVNVDAPGMMPRSVHVFPDLQFSEVGHLYAAYPEEYKIPMKPHQ